MRISSGHPYQDDSNAYKLGTPPAPSPNLEERRTTKWPPSGPDAKIESLPYPKPPSSTLPAAVRHVSLGEPLLFLCSSSSPATLRAGRTGCWAAEIKQRSEIILFLFEISVPTAEGLTQMSADSRQRKMTQRAHPLFPSSSLRFPEIFLRAIVIPVVRGKRNLVNS